MDKHATTQVKVDTGFPPNKKSLFGNKEVLPQFRAWESYKWISPKTSFGGVPYTISTSVTPLKIAIESNLNSPLLAAMVALALKPVRIQALISPSVTNDVFFEVMPYVDGEQRNIKVDHFFPHNPVTRSFVFLHSQAYELWPMLIEKAYAKFLGSYQTMFTLSNADLCDSFDFLTGFPSCCIKHKGRSKDNVWKLLIKAFERSFPVIAK